MNRKPSFSPHQRGFALVVLSALGFGTLPIFGKYAYEAGMTPAALLAWRFGGSAVVLWLLVVLTRTPLPSGHAWRGPLLLGLLYAIGAGAYFNALERIPASETALLYYLFPAIVLLVEFAAFGRRLRPTTLGALVLSLAGCALVVGMNGAISTDALGVGLGLLSAVLYAAHVLIGRRTLRTLPAMTVTAIVITVAGIACAGTALLLHHPLAPAAHWGPIVGIVVLGTVLPTWCFLAGMPLVGAGEASIVTALDPAMGVVLAITLLGEPATAAMVAGTVSILGAAIVIARADATRVRMEQR